MLSQHDCRNQFLYHPTDILVTKKNLLVSLLSNLWEIPNLTPVELNLNNLEKNLYIWVIFLVENIMLDWTIISLYHLFVFTMHCFFFFNGLFLFKIKRKKNRNLNNILKPWSATNRTCIGSKRSGQLYIYTINLYWTLNNILKPSY